MVVRTVGKEEARCGMGEESTSVIGAGLQDG